MPRKPISHLPAYRQLDAAAREYREGIEEAKRDAEILLDAAKRKNYGKLLDAVRKAKAGGLSDYAVGLLTGHTAYHARMALIAEALNGHEVTPTEPQSDALEVLGWTLRRIHEDNPAGEPGGDPWRIAEVTPPEGAAFTLRMMDTYGYWLVNDEADDPTAGRTYHELAPEFVWDWLTRKNWGEEPPGWDAQNMEEEK
jgi:hypothetical protein